MVYKIEYHQKYQNKRYEGVCTLTADSIVEAVHFMFSSVPGLQWMYVRNKVFTRIRYKENTKAVSHGKR